MTLMFIFFATVLQQGTFVAILVAFLWCDSPSYLVCKQFRAAEMYFRTLRIRPVFLDSEHNKCLCTENQCYPMAMLECSDLKCLDRMRSREEKQQHELEQIHGQHHQQQQYIYEDQLEHIRPREQPQQRQKTRAPVYWRGCVFL